MAASNEADPELRADLVKILEAMKISDSLLTLNLQLATEVDKIRVITKRADDIKSDEVLAKRLQKSLTDLDGSCKAVLAAGNAISELNNEFQKDWKEVSKLSAPSQESIDACLSLLNTVLRICESFSEKFSDFRKSLDETMKFCQSLIQKQEHELDKSQEAGKKASKNRKVKVALGLGLSAVILGIASLFTLGATLPAAAAAGAAAAGAAGATAWGMYSHLDLKRLDELAGQLKTDLRRLDRCMDELDGMSERVAEGAQASEQIKRTIEDVMKNAEDRKRRPQRQLQEENELLRQREEEKEEENRLLRQREEEKEEENRLLRERLQTMEEAMKRMKQG